MSTVFTAPAPSPVGWSRARSALVLHVWSRPLNAARSLLRLAHALRHVVWGIGVMCLASDPGGWAGRGVEPWVIVALGWIACEFVAAGAFERTPTHWPPTIRACVALVADIAIVMVPWSIVSFTDGPGTLAGALGLLWLLAIVVCLLRIIEGVSYEHALGVLDRAGSVAE